MKLDKIWEIWEVSKKNMEENMEFMGNMGIMASVDTLSLSNITKEKYLSKNSKKLQPEN